MTAREQDLLRIYGGRNNNSAKDKERILRGSVHSNTMWYGERLPALNDSHWWDTFSSMMQSNHETAVASLNDDNRIDEREIEILQQASEISDKNIYDLKELEDFYTEEHLRAVKSGDKHSAKFYMELANRAKKEREDKTSILEKANGIVKRDKQLFTITGHNPILEAVGEIADETSTYAAGGAMVGSAAGSVAPGAGNVVGGGSGGALGAVIGFAKGIYDYFADGMHDIDRSAYNLPLSDDRNINFANSIATRLSYKDYRSKKIQQELNDLFWWKTEYPVSDYYRYIESTEGGNYAYYNLPGIVGSSFSDTKDMGQLVVGSVGLNKIAKKIPNKKGKFAIRTIAFFEALRNGWQQSLNENHAEASETSTKKAIEEIKKNKELSNEMLDHARAVAMNVYGLDAKDAIDLVDENTAFIMYQGGIGGLNPRKLQNSYDYYRSARLLGDAGADTLFERDMVATAGGDVLEAALMITPYGALAKRSKTIGKAIAGAAIGAASGEFLGFGVEGSIIGGGAGAIVAQNKYARKLWRNTMKKTQAIEDKLLPKLEHQVIFDKSLHAISAFGVSSLAEAAEEGTQYLNSLDAEKILNEADDKINLRNMKNLLVNDLKKRGEVFNAVLSQIGLTDSPYQSDQEFWSNWKGGLVLGGLMTGATVSLSESVGAKKAYEAAKFLREEVLNTAIANRVSSQDAILKGAAFAKYGSNNNLDTILEIIDRAKQKNKNRTNTAFKDEDFDELFELANRIISKFNHSTTQQRLKLLGYDLNSDDAYYAVAVNDYYLQKTRENRAEGLRSNYEITKLMNDPNLLQALSILAGEEDLTAADSFEAVDKNTTSDKDLFTVKRRDENGEIIEELITNRLRLQRVHQNVAELIAVTQLLKDLSDIQNIQDFAKTQGIAFSKNNLDSTLSLLKDKRNLLKADVAQYVGSDFDSDTTTYDQQIEHLKNLLVDQNNGIELAGVYRDITLRMLNQRMYTNIIRSIALDTDVSSKNEDVRKISHSMTKQFIDNVQKNKQLQEILDYVVENADEDAQQIDLESTESQDELQQDKAESEEQNRESWFLRFKRRTKEFFSKNQQHEESQEDYDGPDLQLIVEEEESIDAQEHTDDTNSDGGTIVIHGPVVINEGGTVDQQLEDDGVKEEKQDDVQGPPDVISEDVESAALPQDPEEQVIADTPGDDRLQSQEIITEDPENAVMPTELESVVIVEDQTKDDDAEVHNSEDNQNTAISKLSTIKEDSPRKLLDGWYVTKDGKIIPSDKMYMANPVESSRKGGAEQALKYRSTAAQIRLNIHRFIKDKSDDAKTHLKQYVGGILRTADQVTIDIIADALYKNDQNAIKLLIMHANPRAWESYYVNEYFRKAAREILKGNPVSRPDYIDKDAFKKFCRQVLLYKALIENVYGYKFVTNIAPSITKINGEDVVADPDFVTVDDAGNVHIINVYTINNHSYQQRQKTAETYQMDLGNTKNMFSQDQERNILADIQIKGIRDGIGITASSAALLPVVVDGYTSVNRLYLGKLIPLSPNDTNISKYINQEDQLLELKELLIKANEKATSVINDFNTAIDNLNEYRAQSKRSGSIARLRKRSFVAEKEPSSIAEAYAQLDKALLVIQSAQKYYADYMAKEVSEMEMFHKNQAHAAEKSDIAEQVSKINAMSDETQTTGILVEIVDGDKIINNDNLLSNGVAKALLQTAPDGSKYVRYFIEYNDKQYPIKIYVNRDRKYGKKNGDIFKQNNHPSYTQKMKAITKLLIENPNLTLVFDIRRSFIKYAEDISTAKPRQIIGKDGLLTNDDVNNIGLQQDNGKIVDIGFYDEKTGVIQTGQNTSSATLAHAPEGDYWQNQLFLVIKQKHLEEKTAQDRVVSVPLIRSKFNKKLANFIATCYKVIAETNHQATLDSLKRRMFANQMLHLFIGKRIVYKKGEEELPNIVYINGDAVRLNGTEYYLFDQTQFNAFAEELLKCEIMPNWDTFNAKFKNLSKKSFNSLYDHFSSTQESLKISINGVDSGLEITKEQFDNDSLCQWLVRNQFFYSKYYVARDTVVSIHNIKLTDNVEQLVKQDEKEKQLAVKEYKPEEKKQDATIQMSEEEFEKQGWEEVDEDDEDNDYQSPIIPTSNDFSKIRSIHTSEDVLELISKRYKKLFKLLNIAISNIGIPKIHVMVSEEAGEIATINGIERQKQGNVVQNEDGSWTIRIYATAKDPIKTLAHETVHIFTLGAIQKNASAAKACRVFYQYCKDTFAKDKDKPYGFRSFKEFIAEFFTNDEFREYLLSKLPMELEIFDNAVKNITVEQKSRIRSLFDSIVSLISKIWQKYILKHSPSLYSQIYETMATVFSEAQNIQTKEQSDEYDVKNRITGQKVTLQTCKSRAQLRAAIDGIMAAWIKHENITALGKNIDKLNFSTAAIQKRLEQDIEFAQWWQRTFSYSDKPLIRELTKVSFVTKESLKTEDNPEGFVFYEAKVKLKVLITKKDGTVVTKTVKIPKTFSTKSIPNWDIITPIIDEFMSDMRIETRKAIQDRKEDLEMDDREEGRNTWGELLTENYEISPFERASREVKWMFSTVPYGKVVTNEDGTLSWNETTDHNEFGMNTFMPFKDVYGKVLYYTANCHTTNEILQRFLELAHTGPDKAMFLYLYNTLSDMIANRWKPIHEDGNKSNPVKNENGLFFDANIDCTIIKIIRALRQQTNDFIWATVEDVTDKDRNKYKKIDIRTTLYQKKAIETSKSWRDLLATGMSDVLKYDPETKTYEFKSGIKINVFRKIYRDLFYGKTSFISAYNKIRQQEPEDVTLDWLYLLNSGNIKFSEITSDDIKTYLHNALLHCGVDISEEIIDHWLNQIKTDNPTIKTDMDALYAFFSDLHSNYRPSSFFARLANMSENGEVVESTITQDTIINAFNSGFIKLLANLLNEYDLRTQGLMTVASHNNQYYIVSESNFINDTKDIINSADKNDAYIDMLLKDSFAQGSVIAEALAKDEPIHIDVHTFVGMKTKNVGDLGRDYFEIELSEDIISKLELLHEGYMIAPTTSDKKTYHTISGIPLVGMRRGEKANDDCYWVNPKTGNILIVDDEILDRFIAYFRSERNAVEKAVIAYETEFYKNNPGKKIANYSDKNGLKFSSFCCLPLAKNEYLNKDINENPRVNLNAADTLFFSQDIKTQRKIMLRILLQRAEEDIKKIEEEGLIKKNETTGLYENIGLDGATILLMAESRVKAAFGENSKLSDYEDESGRHFGPRKAFAISSAVREYCLDCTIKHLMSMQEYQRLFSGSKSFYKWKSKGENVVDISVDYTKRRGGDISTGGVNIFDIPSLEGMEELGTYRCLEMEDVTLSSRTLSESALIEQFQRSSLTSIATSLLDDKKSSLDLKSNKVNSDEAEDIIRSILSDEHDEKYANAIINTIKNSAEKDAKLYFRQIGDKEDPINVADGATYITDRMCERLLREEGKWDDHMKYAFEVLRGEHGVDVLSKEGHTLYKSILDVIIGTQKYTATGFRKSDDGLGGVLMTPYYNKTALFPLFDLIAYGKTAKMLEAMRKNNVDVLMMTSAVKTGSQGAITFDQLLDDQTCSDHTYVQEIRFLRKQLNTDPNEREEMNLGTQTIKIALSNLRMDDDYVDPFSGKTVKGRQLYSTIMNCYNILTDIGYEQVMLRFCKKRTDGLSAFLIGVVLGDGTVGVSQKPEIDAKALSDFLHEELMSRDANDNMFDAIGYDKENDRLNAPVSAISQSGWIDSILSAYISKTIIDTKSPGAAYILRSVLGMEGDDVKTLNDGKDLKLINDDGSMDAIISIDFFEHLIPGYENKTFEEARQWLIDHKLIGQDAKTYTISYRIPTQAQSSINPLKFVDVIPVVRDTIILPKDFTRLTGSDFDIDKLFLSRMHINPETVEDENKMFTFYDTLNLSNPNKTLDVLRKGFTNKLFQNYITLLTDKASQNTKWRPIDADTELWKSVHRDLYPESHSPLESMLQDTIAYQTQQKNNFVVGKIGIGPYALNNNNHIYTMIYDISVRSSLFSKYGMNSLSKGYDIYNNSIMSWLSGGINAHVDIAKDPFVTKLNINKYTYNISNFLIRAGFGKNGLWFLNIPVIKELASRQNKITGEYLKSTTKSLFDAQKEVIEKYKEELGSKIPEEVLNKEFTDPVYVLDVDAKGAIINVNAMEFILIALGRHITLKDLLLDRVNILNKVRFSKKLTKEQQSHAAAGINILYKEQFVDVYTKDMCTAYKDGSETDSMIYCQAKGVEFSKSMPLDKSVHDYLSVDIFDQINQNEAKTLSDIVKYSKIDTKKHGSTIAAQLDYKISYEKFVAGLSSTRPKVYGNTEGLFGYGEQTGAQDILGFQSSINLSRWQNESGVTDYTGLLGQENEVFIVDTRGENAQGTDITESSFVKSNLPEYTSFIRNKTQKAINSLISILNNESIESTYGFEYIWRAVKSDFDKTSLTEDMQKKLRATILGAVKSRWCMEAAARYGINPISLFKDKEGSFSLAHELYRLKTRSIRVAKENGKRGVSITTVGKMFKDNELLKILHDAHSKDDYELTGRLTDILDFIKIHIPFTEDSAKANVYINAWRDLYENDITKDFAVKLMFYSFITSNDEGGANLFKYVPFEMLQEFGLFDAERRIILDLNNEEFLYHSVGEQEFSENTLNIIDFLVSEVETILCEDFDFSQPFHLETKQERLDKITGDAQQYDRKEYTGFCSAFGNKIVKKGLAEESDRIPYMFTPVRINSYGTASKSKTLVDSNGNVINRPYIRVYNPVHNYENQPRYFIYKKIGSFYVGKVLYPIYKLVNSSMYTLGEYKIYNYDNRMNISSTEVLKTFENYIYSENFSINELDEWISNIVKLVNNTEFDNIKLPIDILSTLDQSMMAAHAQHVKEQRISDIKSVLFSKFKDGSYVEFFKNQNNTGKDKTISDLNFVSTSESFTAEEKEIASEMLSEINKYKELLEQIKAGKKQPNNKANPYTYHMHSGGAYGSDTAWGYYAQQYGIPNDPQHISHYYFGQKTPTGNVSLTRELFFEGLDKVFVADQTLHRFDNMSEERQKKIAPLLARNWMLVKNSDSIFAIGEIKYGSVDGGTGWAVLMAIDAGKPVHVFNLSTELWFTYDYEKRTWVVESTPKLTKNFAGIGTRSIDKDIESKTADYKKPVKYVGDLKRQAVINAINDVFKNTFGEPKNQDNTVQNDAQRFNNQEEDKSEKTPLQTAIEKAEGFIGETNGSVYLKLDDKFVLKSGTLLLDALKTITDRGHNPGKWSFVDDYDGQVSYNIGYESGTNAVMSVTNRDLYDEGWIPSTILAIREDNRIGNPLDLTFKLYIDQFGKDVTFLVSKKDKPLLEYLNSRGYRYEIYDKPSTKDKEPVFTKVNDAFAEVLIKHLLNDTMPGYETKEKREFLANLARGVFLWIKREKFKVLITNAPYSDVEAGKSSTVSIFASFATIYYQDVDLLGNKYLNILHELLHIITKQAIPFDSMGRVIEDEKLQLYYDMFKRKVMSDPEWKYIRDVVFNPTQETFDKASNRAKILAHAYSDAGEFISCCVSNVEVQLVLESITYDETQKSTLFDEIKQWFGELINKIFRGNKKLSHSNFIEDVTNFLFGVKYDMRYVHLMLDSGDFEAQAEYLKYINSLRERYNNAIDFGATPSTNTLKKVSSDVIKTANGTIVENSEWITADGLYLPLDMAEFKVVSTGGINISFEFTGRQNPDGEWIFINIDGNEVYENLTGYKNLRLYDPDGTDVTDQYRVSTDAGIINVSSYDEETKSLSNFAIRPFETELAKGTPKMKFKSVEHAFLASKAYFAWNRGDITDKQFWDFIKYINTREGKDVKSAGRAIPMSLTTIGEWNKVSDKVLEVMMLRSFLLNETATSQLLRTGNAEFTHNYKNGQPIEPKTPKRFGNLLSKVRSKLRDESNRKQECK